MKTGIRVVFVWNHMKSIFFLGKRRCRMAVFEGEGADKANRAAQAYDEVPRRLGNGSVSADDRVVDRVLAVEPGMSISCLPGLRDSAGHLQISRTNKELIGSLRSSGVRG